MTGIFAHSSVSSLLWITFGSGVFAVIAAMVCRAIIGAQNPGNDVMQALGGKIRAGAMAFLTKEYQVIVPFMLIAAVLIYIFLDTGWTNVGADWALRTRRSASSSVHSLRLSPDSSECVPPRWQTLAQQKLLAQASSKHFASHSSAVPPWVCPSSDSGSSVL